MIIQNKYSAVVQEIARTAPCPYAQAGIRDDLDAYPEDRIMSYQMK